MSYNNRGIKVEVVDLTDGDELPETKPNYTPQQLAPARAMDNFMVRVDKQKQNEKENLVFIVEMGLAAVFSEDDSNYDTINSGPKNLADRVWESWLRSGVPLAELGPQVTHDMARTIKAGRMKQVRALLERAKTAARVWEFKLKEEISKEMNNNSNELLMVREIEDLERDAEKLCEAVKELRKFCPPRAGIDSASMLANKFCSDHPGAPGQQHRF